MIPLHSGKTANFLGSRGDRNTAVGIPPPEGSRKLWYPEKNADVMFGIAIARYLPNPFLWQSGKASPH